MIQQLSNEPTSRRAMCRAAVGAAFGAAAVAGAGLFSPSSALAVTPVLTLSDIPGTGDVKVLNFALALEDLEADLYRQALARLTGGGKNRLGRKINGLGLSGSQADVAFTRIFGKVEAEHAALLRATLKSEGGPVISPFRYDFGIERMNRRQVVDLLYLAEATGTGAYLGGIPLLETTTYLQVAGAIQGTEARHTAVFAAVLNALFKAGLNVAPLATQNNGIDQPIAPNTVLARVSPFIVV